MVTIPDTFVQTLKKLTIVMVQGCPKLNKKFAVPCQRSILLVMTAFASKPELLKTLVSDIGKFLKHIRKAIKFFMLKIKFFMLSPVWATAFIGTRT